MTSEAGGAEVNDLSRKYDASFFARQRSTSHSSAETVLPVVFGMLPRIGSLLDVGCGAGSWLRAAREIDPQLDIFGMDHPGVSADVLGIERDRFRGADLTKPFDLGRRFDLVMSLEVAEHLPDSAADVFVANLVRHADTVLFSAAIPGQGGTSHVNEQWPTYWARKFEVHGYVCHDVVRPALWDREAVEFWYRQNAFLFTRDARVSEGLRNHPNWSGRHFVHPNCLSGGLGLKASWALFRGALVRKLRWKLGLGEAPVAS